MLSAPQQLELELVDPGRWPRRPYCADDLSAGLRIRSFKQAITKPYIQANPPHLRVWSIYDVDRAGGALAWEDAGLPPPSWAAANRENAHAHLVWGLTAPVLVDSPDMRQAPLRYLCGVEAAFRERLQADQGYSGLITKNPAHPLWRTLRGPQLAYELGELAEWVDLPKHLPKRKPEEIGLGRNVTVFDWLRQHAYRHIRHYKGDVRNFVLWQSHLNAKTLERNGDLLTPMDGRFAPVGSFLCAARAGPVVRQARTEGGLCTGGCCPQGAVLCFLGGTGGGRRHAAENSALTNLPKHTN